MNQAAASFWEEVKPKFYIFCAGLVVGLFLGWFFHGLVGTLVRIFIVLLILVPVVAAFLFWRSVSNDRSKAPMSDVTDASWREVDDRP
jgi:F0F1-type ATP synthase assembly protein I